MELTLRVALCLLLFLCLYELSELQTRKGRLMVPAKTCKIESDGTDVYVSQPHPARLPLVNPPRGLHQLD